MTPTHNHRDLLFAIRPLVRYVDERQAIVDVYVSIFQSRHPHGRNPDISALPLEVHVLVEGPDGCAYQQQTRLNIQGQAGRIRFEMGDPQRWWPSGMGDQTLYNLSVSILVNDESVYQWNNTIGLTSVRPVNVQPVFTGDVSHDTAGMGMALEKEATLLVNGRQCLIRTVVPVNPDDEQSVLPVGEHCLLVVRGHYGPDLLYDAADRAGTLLVQSIPVTADLHGSDRSQIDRLAGHPSLAGWLVGPADQAADMIASRIHEMDPTRSVLRHLDRSAG